MVFREKFLEVTFGVRTAGCVNFFWLVGGKAWCSDSGLAWSCHPPPRWGTFIPTEELKDVIYIPWGETKILLLWLHYSFLIVPPLFLPFLISLTSNYLNLFFDIKECLGACSFFPANKKWGAQKGFCAQEGPTESCLISSLDFVRSPMQVWS